MRARPLADVLLRAAAAIGLAVSLLLLADYTSALAGLCGDGGGCDVVKASAYARPGGVPLPVFGVAYFLVLGVVASVPRLRRALVPLALAGAAGALVLLSLQAFVIGAFCRLCLVADAAAVLAGVAALALRGHAGLAGARAHVCAAALAVVALGVPGALVLQAPPPPPAVALTGVPAEIAREQRAGWLTIVEFVDFECPFCRRLHVALEEALAGVEARARVRVVRKMVPLAGLHPHAEGAALAWCCADAAGQGDAMADRLSRAPDLTPAACERIAAALGLDLAAFRGCVAAPATRARVDADLAASDAAGVARRLPTYWIGGTMYRGAADAAVLRARIEAALAKG